MSASRSQIAVPAAIALVWASTLFVPQIARNGVTVLVGLALAGVLAGVDLVLSRRDERSHADRSPWPLLLALVPAVALLPGLIMSVDPMVSLTGAASIRLGLATWVLVGVWFAAPFALATKATLRPLLAVLAVCGAIAAAMAYVDAAGGLHIVYRWSNSAAGMFIDPNTLAQALALSMGCAAACALSARGRVPRIIWWALSALMAPALVLTGSRGVFVAVVLALPLLALSRRTPSPQAVMIGTPLALLGVLAVQIVLGVGVLGPKLTAAAESLASGRVGGWHAAIAQWLTSPIFGRGPGLFSAWYQWTPNASAALGVDLVGTFDPHSILMTALVGGGIVGLLALVTVATLATGACVRVLSSGTNAPLRVTLAGVLAVGLSSLLEVPNPLVLATAAAVLGTVLGASRTTKHTRAKDAPSRANTAAVAGVALVALLMAAMLARPVSTEVTWSRGPQPGEDRVSRLSAFFAQTGDSLYATQALETLLTQNSATSADLNTATARLSRASRWNVNAAFLRARAADRTGDTAAYASALAAGREADPASSVWEYLAR